ncbi:transcription initiation factor TFIID subunit 14 [Mucor ambiguus]|uniref:Transcription initiation factor TFIID subunit 14 n=1 Tax=Mucor ambiguus TaxID=91626 RepID=A0A0C9M6B3_9FUNG|nr:transcription initiation factor TFIID subunit 14 [Mucor ambiguus]
MAVVTQDIKISCHNSVIKGHGAKSNDGHPWRNWKITLVAMDGEREVKGKLSMILDHVEYILHPTFEEPRRVKKEEPYVLQEKGWGEFDMRVVLYFTDNITDPQVLLFDLNFALASYSITHSVEFPNASTELVRLLSRDPSSASTSTATSAASTPRKGGKKPAPSTSTNEGRQAKKKPISSSPHSKTAKKAKPDTKSTTPISSKKLRKSSTSSSSPAPAPAAVTTSQSPVYDQPSPSDYSTHSSPSLIATTTPDLHPADTEEEETKALHSRSSSDSSSNRIVDHTYKIADVYNLNSIHHAKLDKRLRDKWDIPDINMMELAKRIYRMSPEQTTEFGSIIFENTPEGIKTVIDPDGGIGIDLYSLGKPLLEKLWDFLADMASDDNESFTSQDHHESDLEFDSDAELGEYKSDDNDNNHYTDMDEPGFFHQSDMESDYTDPHTNHRQTNGHHHYTHPAAATENGYHDNSDMDIQDDDDY